MEKNIFAKLNERKISEIKAGIDWLLESYEENKRELEEYRAQTRNDTIIKEKNEQIVKLEAKLHEYERKEWDIVDFGFSEEELKEAGKWAEEHYKTSGHRGRRKLFLYYYTNWIGNNQGSEMFLRRITYNSGPYVKGE